MAAWVFATAGYSLADAAAWGRGRHVPTREGQASLYRVTLADGSQGFVSVNFHRPDTDSMILALVTGGGGRAVQSTSLHTNWLGSGQPATQTDLAVRRGGQHILLSQSVQGESQSFDPPLVLWAPNWLRATPDRRVTGATRVNGALLDYAAWRGENSSVSVGGLRLDAVTIETEWRTDGEVVRRTKSWIVSGLGQTLVETRDADGNLLERRELINSTLLPQAEGAPWLPIAELLGDGGMEAAFFREGPERTGAYSGAGLTDLRLSVAFSASLGAGFTGSVVHAGGMAHAGDQSGRILALEPDTGRIEWFFGAGGPVVAAPAVANGIVYVGAADKTLYALEAANGLYLWSRRSFDNFAASPLVVDGLVLAASEDRLLHALDAKTGAPRWVFRASGRLVSSPATAEGGVFIGDGDGLLYGIDAGSGKMLWRVGLDGAIEATPAVGADGVVYAASRGGSITAVKATTGEVLWTQTTRFGHLASPAVGPEHIFLADSGGTVRALERGSGRIAWEILRAGDSSGFTSSPLLLGSQLVTVDTHGGLRVWDAATGVELHSLALGDTVTASPTWTGELLLIVNHSGHFIAMQPIGD
jgi:eukaryotic-like serine/threonine-protein kinase